MVQSYITAADQTRIRRNDLNLGARNIRYLRALIVDAMNHFTEFGGNDFKNSNRWIRISTILNCGQDLRWDKIRPQTDR